jgi:hypothetical protein
MRFMLIVLEDAQSEGGAVSDRTDAAAMSTYEEQLVRAGVLLAGAVLTPSAGGKRMTFAGDKRDVADGPFADPSEVVAGYWMIQTSGEDEALEWCRRIPFTTGMVEVRRVAGDGHR